MTGLTTLPSADVRRIAESALAGMDMKLSGVGERDVIAELEKSLRFDHDRQRFFVVDDAGNQRVTVDSTGDVHDVGLDDHLRSIAATKPAAFTGAVRDGTPDNPFMAGPTFNRTQQAMLTRSDPETAHRMKAEATGGGGDPGNPWAKETFNRTRQAVITKTNPDEAKRLKEAAR